ncbi:MAG TPA: ornithine cyclodeaminase family protein [Streptosporangiaceae bacterium]|jgi:ornithine cyclodeaminase
MRVLVLSHADVLAALPPAACAEVMAAALAGHARRDSFQPLRSVMIPPEAAGFMGLMPAWRGPQPDRATTFGLKAVCIIPANPARGLDAHQGLVTLFDGETGQPTAILDAAALTEVRTAAVSAVATRALARPQSRVLAILGAGTQGRAHLTALTLAGEYEQVRIYSPRPARARELAAAAGQGPELVVAASAQQAVDGADVVVTATSSREPVLRRDWLAAGTHVNAVGASSPSARELDTATVAASALFCDSRESLRNEAGEFALAIEEGLIAGEEHVRAELGEVLAGLAPGRLDAGELTVFRSLGLAIEDLAAAQSALAAAQASGLGTEVEL